MKIKEFADQLEQLIEKAKRALSFDDIISELEDARDGVEAEAEEARADEEEAKEAEEPEEK